MYLGFETILDVYSHKDKKILCQIKVNPKNHKFKNCRCLSQEQWNAFDKELEKLIATIDDWSNEKCLKFIIKPYIQVKVQKSSLSLEHFYKCCGKTVDCLMGDEMFADVVEANCVLECIFDFHWDVPLSSPIKSHEFEAYTETSLDDMSCSPYYVPYTPFKKKYKKTAIDNGTTPSADTFECDENTYSPELSNEKAAVDPKLNVLPILRESSGACQSKCHNKVLDRKETDIESPKKDNSLKKSSNKKSERMESQEQCVIKAALKEKVDQTDYTENPERSKSKEIFEENTKEGCSSHCDAKFLRIRSKTLDEIPANFKKTYPQNALEERKEQKVDKTNRISSHKSKSKKNKKHLHEKKSKSSLSENKIMEILAKRSKGSLDERHHEFEDGDKCEKHLISQRRNENNSNSNVPPSSPADSTTEVSPQEIIRIEIKPKASSSSKNASKSVRRSERSPSKPKRFIEEQQHITKKRSEKLRSLFGVDDNDDHYFENNNGGNMNSDNKKKAPVFETPESKKTTYSSTSSSSSAKNKKRKRNKSEECEQEKRNINKWLSKKQSSALPLKTSSKVKSRKYEDDSHSASSSLMSLELPSKEELELIRSKTKLMQKANEKVRAELDKMRTSPPKEVQILSLQNTPIDEILDTFSTYKSELDEIFENNRKRDYIKGHDGINHCFVIRLLQKNIQMKMLDKLTEVYSNSKTTTQATLFANALLPEWVIRVYMEKFNFTRQQAINQIKAQEEFQLHMEEQSDNTFLFD